MIPLTPLVRRARKRGQLPRRESPVSPWQFASVVSLFSAGLKVTPQPLSAKKRLAAPSPEHLPDSLGTETVRYYLIARLIDRREPDMAVAIQGNCARLASRINFCNLKRHTPARTTANRNADRRR